MKLFYPSNPSLIGKGKEGWPALRAEAHTKANGIGGYLGKDGTTLTNADGSEVLRRIEVKWEESWGGDPIGEFYPAVLFLPHGRILAGFTMGKGMIADFDLDEIFDDKEEPWYRAQGNAENAAMREMEYQKTQELPMLAEMKNAFRDASKIAFVPDQDGDYWEVERRDMPPVRVHSREELCENIVSKTLSKNCAKIS